MTQRASGILFYFIDSRRLIYNAKDTAGLDDDHRDACSAIDVRL